jgi:hypothetical protein
VRPLEPIHDLAVAQLARSRAVDVRPELSRSRVGTGMLRRHVRGLLVATTRD